LPLLKFQPSYLNKIVYWQAACSTRTLRVATTTCRIWINRQKKPWNKEPIFSH